MIRPRIELDFARNRNAVNRSGVALLAVGIAAAALVIGDYRGVAAQRSAVEMRLAAIGPEHPAVPDRAAAQAAEEARDAFHELVTPWAILLQELERAAADSDGSVALLAVEPDREKHQVRVLAEARTLPIALAYVERLQKSAALRYPMLESHELQAKDPERPVRFQIRADWKALP